VGPGKAVLLEGDGLPKVDPVLRIADEALSVASAVAVARPLTPSVRTVDPLVGSEAHHVVQMLNQRRAFVTEATDPRACFAWRAAVRRRLQ
jgi:hypothetical protein